jgi:hypothetical protein
MSPRSSAARQAKRAAATDVQRATAVDPLLREMDESGAIEETLDASSKLTRADLLRGMAVTGAATVGAGGTSAAFAAANGRGDVAILNYALSLEYLQAAFYSEAVQRGALSGSLAEQAQVVGGHERAHVAAIRKVLGAKAIKKPAFDFKGVTENPKTFRETAVAFEDLAVAAYQDRAPAISSRAYLAAVTGILSVEARHASWIRRLAGIVPAPHAFDEPLAPAGVEKLVAATHFIVKPPRMSTHTAPHFTG